MNLRRTWPVLLIAALLGLGAVAYLKLSGSGFTDEEVEMIERAVNVRPPPDDSACVRIPLDGQSKAGPGTALFLEAVSPDGPNKGCYDLVSRLSVDALAELALPEASVSEQGRSAWLGYWQAPESSTQLEVRQRCDALVHSLVKAVSFDEACPPLSMDYLGHSKSVVTAMNVAPLLLRALMRDGREIEAATLSLNLLRAKQTLGQARSNSVTSLVAYSRGVVLSFLTELVLSGRLSHEDSQVVHGQLLRLIASIPTPENHATYEERTLLVEMTISQLEQGKDCDSDCRFAQFVLVAMRDSRGLCEGLSYLACGQKWNAWADTLTLDLLPKRLPRIADKKLGAKALKEVKDLARVRSQYTLKISHYYAALIALELALRSQDESCPAPAMENQLGTALALETNESWTRLVVPSELATRPGGAVSNSHLLTLRCPDPVE